MKAREIMTRDVVTVTQSTSIAEIATLLVRNKISAVPVISDDNSIIGIVSESDLMHRDETGTDHPKWWLELFLSADGRARDYVKSHGLKAENVMTRTVISVSEDADVANIADILESHRAAEYSQRPRRHGRRQRLIQIKWWALLATCHQPPTGNRLARKPEFSRRSANGCAARSRGRKGSWGQSLPKEPCVGVARFVAA
jgi:CBS domain-containing protein